MQATADSLRPARPQSLVRYRAGAGEPLVLLHGVGESAVAWRPVQDLLAREYDVLTLDLPGFGTSPDLPGSALPTPAALADAIELEMNALGIGAFHVAGCSMGARVALELAIRGRVRSVVAIAPNGLASPPERIYQATALMTGHVLATMMSPIADVVSASPSGRSMFFAMERSRPWRVTPDDARRLLGNFADAPGFTPTVWVTLFDVPLRLDRIACPVLIMQGTLDPLASMQSPRFLPFVPHAKLRWLPGLSHVPMSDDPALVAGQMLGFLASVSTEGACDAAA